MKNKDLIILGITIGIIFFFIGLIISNVFPSNSESLVSYKLSAFMKLIGIGFLTTSMLIGGLILSSFDKNLRLILFLFGLILLIIYTIGSPILTWEISKDLSTLPGGSTGSEASEEIFDSRPTSLGTPGFEFIYLIAAIISIYILRKYKQKG